MDLQSLEKFSQKKGLEIMQVLLEEHDLVDLEINNRAIEKEIYDIATSYSKILFFEAKKFLNESTRDEVKAHLSSRFDSKQVKKMKDIDLVAHWIKLEVFRALQDRGVFL